MNREPISMPAEVVKRVKDADGAVCRDCGQQFDPFHQQSVPWTWRQAQLMHEKGTGHRVDMFRYVNEEEEAP